VEASLTSGETIFKNLTLKPTALDQFNLPIEIKEGALPHRYLNPPFINPKITKCMLDVTYGAQITIDQSLRAQTRHLPAFITSLY